MREQTPHPRRYRRRAWALSNVVRKQIIREYCEEGLSAKLVALRCRVGESTVYHVVQQHKVATANVSSPASTPTQLPTVCARFEISVWSNGGVTAKQISRENT